MSPMSFTPRAAEPLLPSMPRSVMAHCGAGAASAATDHAHAAAAIQCFMFIALLLVSFRHQHERHAAGRRLVAVARDPAAVVDAGGTDVRVAGRLHLGNLREHR